MLLVQTELQKAINTILKTDAALIALLPKRRDDASRPAVFDDVPQNQAFPYVVIGDFTSDPFRAKGSPGENLVEVINVLTDVPDLTGLYAIGNRIQELLGDKTGATFAVTDEHVIGSWFEGAARFRNPDEAGDWTRRLELSYRFRVQNDP